MGKGRRVTGLRRKIKREPPSAQLAVAAVAISHELRDCIQELPEALADFGIPQSQLETPTHDIGVQCGYTAAGRLMVEIELYVHWLVRGAPPEKGGECDSDTGE